MTTPTDSDRSSGWITAEHVGGGFRTNIVARTHDIVADEPIVDGGTDAGPTPYELLLGALAACTAMTVRMYADRKRWPLEGIVVRIRPVKAHAPDCAACETEDVGVGRLSREVELLGTLTDEQRTRLLYIADRCPVKQTLQRGLVIESASPQPPSVTAS
jgi:putative redox protein